MIECYDVTDGSYVVQPPLCHKMLMDYIWSSCLQRVKSWYSQLLYFKKGLTSSLQTLKRIQH